MVQLEQLIDHAFLFFLSRRLLGGELDCFLYNLLQIALSVCRGLKNFSDEEFLIGGLSSCLYK
jgi:hypothetical protein